MNWQTSVAIVSILLSGAVNAANLLDVYKLAYDNDARFQAVQFQYKIANEVLPQAKAGLLPDVAFAAERIHTEQEIVSSDNTVLGSGETDFPTTDLTLSLTQPVFRYDSWIGYQQAKSAVKQADIELSAAFQQLIFDVAGAYFAVLTAKDNLEFARVEKAAVGKQLENAISRAKTGVARITDVYDAEARFSISESREVEAENALDDSYQALQEFTGQYITQLAAVQESMPLVSPEPADPGQWTEKALTQNLALEARTISLDIATQEIKRQRAGHMPTLDLVATRNRRDTEGSLFGGGSEVDTTDYLLRFNLPIYQGGSVNSKMRVAYNEREKSMSELEAERRLVVRETHAAYLGVLSGIKKVEALKKSIIAQEKTLEVKTAGVRAGVNTLLELLDAQRDLYFAQRDYSKARYDYLLSNLKLKQATGSLSITDLEQINRLVK